MTRSLQKKLSNTPTMKNLNNIPKIRALLNGERLRCSECKDGFFKAAISEGVLDAQRRKGDSSKMVEAPYPSEFRQFACEFYQVPSIDNLYHLHDTKSSQGSVSREELAKNTLGTKTYSSRVASGLLYNVSSPIKAVYQNRPITINPTETGPQMVLFPGLLRLPDNVVIISAENAEIVGLRANAELFEKEFGVPVVYAYRPTRSKAHLHEFLAANASNRYIHWGDFDWGGIRIYLSEFKAKYKERSTFWVPDNIDAFIKLTAARENKKLLAGQPPVPAEKVREEAGLQRLWNWLMMHDAGVEQEGLIVTAKDLLSL